MSDTNANSPQILTDLSVKLVDLGKEINKIVRTYNVEAGKAYRLRNKSKDDPKEGYSLDDHKRKIMKDGAPDDAETFTSLEQISKNQLEIDKLSVLVAAINRIQHVPTPQEADLLLGAANLLRKVEVDIKSLNKSDLPKGQRTYKGFMMPILAAIGEAEILLNEIIPILEPKSETFAQLMEPYSKSLAARVTASQKATRVRG